MRRAVLELLVLPSVLLLVGCGDGGGDPHPCAAQVGSFSPLATRCQHLVDGAGRVVILSGMNARIEGLFDVSFDDGRVALESIPPFTLEDARRMRQLGYDFLRLPVNWSGLEPTETGGLSEMYLAKMAEVIALAKQAGLLVLIDFHQDAYSKEIGEDGAPSWAIQPPPEMLLQGPLLDLTERRLSTQVMRAFETFFGDAEPGPRLRARFYAMAAAVAARFKDQPAVFGVELYNEPVIGDAPLYRFHFEAARAVRAAAPAKLILFEPNAYRNQLDLAEVPAQTFEAQSTVAGAVYAPHIYTVSFSSSDELRRTFTREDLRPSNAYAVREAEGWGTPLVITEWGYDPRGIRAREYLELQIDIQDELMLSAAYWVWKEDSQGSWGMYDRDPSGAWVERAELRKMLARVRPRAIAGWPEAYRYDRTARRFELRYRGDREVSAPNLLFVPEADDFAATFRVTCDGVEVAVTREPSSGSIEVPCNGAGNHVVVVSAL